MTWPQLIQEYNNLQQIHGDTNLDSIISGGKLENPKICLVFMNPTGRNIASEKTWSSLKSPWIGTKNIWKLLLETELISPNTFDEIRNRKPQEWTEKFSEQVYKNIEENNVYITNLAKCTQKDARPLPNSVFREYRKYFLKELDLVKPERIITFGNQVSSILLEQNISVSKDRKKIYTIQTPTISTPVLPVYYPVGQGQRNIGKAIEDTRWFLNK